MKQNNSALYSALSFLLIALLMLSILGVIMRYTNGGTTDFALFYVAHDGQNIMTDTTVSLNDGETATFVPKYAADDIMHSVGQETEKKGYNVKIVPNITKETSFTYRVDDNKYRFEKLADTDFSSAFNLKKEEKTFSVKIDEFTVKKLLSAWHEDKTVTIPENFDHKQTYFNMIVSSYDEKSNIVIGLQSSGLISFMLDGAEYQAERGATFENWIKSNDCPLSVQNSLIVDGTTYPIYLDKVDGACVSFISSVESGKSYYAVTHLNTISISAFGKEIPSFTIRVPFHMTWGEFVESDYNAKGSASRFYIYSGVFGKAVHYTTFYNGKTFVFEVRNNGVQYSYDYIYTNEGRYVLKSVSERNV